MSMYLGLLAMDEAASKECGAITLDLLLRAGVLLHEYDGSWALAEDYMSRRIYVYGGAKTIENIAKFVRDVQERQISFSEANMQSEIFLEALTCVRDLPGDWHTGLNTLTSIYNLYYVGFLDQFQDLLGWKKINKDVRSCYYGASRLVEFVSDELMRFFIHQFVSSRSIVGDDFALSDCQIICKMATEFSQFLKDQQDSDDKWVSMCANFLQMSFDFFRFVDGYRVGDSIAIEFGYIKHVPVWHAMGQNKYVEITHAQNETLYRDSPFSMLQEIRGSRTVRRYHGKTGKRRVAQDEFLEHGNRFFSEFPMPKTLASFAFQSNYVGLGLLCKNFTDLWCSTVWHGDDEATYTSSVAPSMAPERKLIYEVFGLLQTHMSSVRRTKFKKTYVTSIRKQISVDICRTVLESSMHESPATTADDILTSLNLVLNNAKTTGVDPTEELDVADINEVNAMKEFDNFVEEEELPTVLAPEDSTADGENEDNCLPDSVEAFTKKKIHEYMLKDPWQIGHEKLKTMDVLFTWAERARRLEKKSRIRKCILNGIKDLVDQVTKIEVGQELDGINHCHQYTRGRRKKLNLK